MTQLRRESRFIIPFLSLELYDVYTVPQGDWTEVYRIPEHPGFDQLLTPETVSELLRQVNERRNRIGKDTLLTADMLYVWRPYFDWLHNEDPHFGVMASPLYDPATYKNPRAFNNAKGSRRLPFMALCINDTLVIDRTFDPQFRKGDIVLSINGVTASEYMEYNYRMRYVNPLRLMLNYYFSFAVDNFDVVLLRNNREIIVNTKGSTSNEFTKNFSIPEEYDVTVYNNANAGYVQIKKFYPSNNRLIKIVRSAIADFKKQGLTNVIIDVRRNPGGSGHNLDKLLSIFIDKPVIPYMKSQRLKVSEQTVGDYDFLDESMIGQLVDIPEKHIVKEITTDPKMFVDGMNYYLLVSKDTGSTAATFVNILQYNDAAVIVGEPLMHNALKYGEIIETDPLGHTLLIPTGVSTMEFNEYTKAVNRVLMPDIHIPFVAAEFSRGEDGVLLRLLDILSSEQAER